MKKIIYALLFVAAAGTAVHAQSTTPAIPATASPSGEVNNDPNAPEIVFETEVHDFGTIEYGGDGTYDFKFTNTGKRDHAVAQFHNGQKSRLQKVSQE